MAAEPGRHWRWLVLIQLLPGALLAWRAGDRGLGLMHMDLIGHVWTIWDISTGGDPTRTKMVAWPTGVDLLPILGGWLDVLIGGALAQALPLFVAWNVVIALYMGLAGAGCHVLARVMGAHPLAACAAGLVAQFDGYLWGHLGDGRTEQCAHGLIALAVAGMIWSWRRQSMAAAVGAGLAGFLVLLASWELGMFLALSSPFLAWALVHEGRSNGGPLRWAIALGTALALAIPWAGSFVLRASQVRVSQEGLGMLGEAMSDSTVLMTWLVADAARRPAHLGLLGVLLLPWLFPKGRRAVPACLSALSLLGLVLALGPSPGVFEANDVWPGRLWAPFALFAHVPVLSWFHTPDRFTVIWSIMAPVAGALLLTRLAPTPTRWGGPVLAIGAVLLVAQAAHQSRPVITLEPHTFAFPHSPALDAVRASAEQGAVLDFPPKPPGIEVLRYQWLQLVHQRPIAGHMTLAHLTSDAYADLRRDHPAVDWMARPMRSAPPEDWKTALENLHSAGVGFVVLHPRLVPTNQRSQTRAAWKTAMGSPHHKDGITLQVWELSRVIAQLDRD